MKKEVHITHDTQTHTFEVTTEGGSKTTWLHSGDCPECGSVHQYGTTDFGSPVDLCAACETFRFHADHDERSKSFSIYDIQHITQALRQINLLTRFPMGY